MKKERKCNPNKLEFGNVRSQKSLYYKRLISWKQTSDIAIPIPTVEGRGYPKINIGGHRASIDYPFPCENVR